MRFFGLSRPIHKNPVRSANGANKEREIVGIGDAGSLRPSVNRRERDRAEFGQPIAAKIAPGVNHRRLDGRQFRGDHFIRDRLAGGGEDRHEMFGRLRPFMPPRDPAGYFPRLSSSSPLRIAATCSAAHMTHSRNNPISGSVSNRSAASGE